MDTSELLSFVLSIFSSVLSGVLIPILLGFIRSQQGRPKIVKSHWIAAAVIAVGLFIALRYYSRPSPELGITGMNENQPEILADGRAQYELNISGYVRHWEGNVYVVVKPPGAAPWYVQSAVTLDPKEVNGTRGWQGKATFYTNRQLPGEEFQVYALATKAEYKEGEIVNDTAPAGPKSSVSTVWGATK
jgi:hypothetical protein